MMFKITIEGGNMTELAAAAVALAAQFQTTAGPYEAPKPTAKRAAPKTKPTDEEQVDAAIKAEDEVDRELLAPVEAAPATANSVVDAGTGQAIPQTKKITMDDVRSAATQLAGTDTPKLKELITKHGGTKLSDIPPASLPSFYGDVLEAIG